ncbi:MAG TPA: type II secretion system F family protein [Candidatus Sulfopaludibacter sp.]|jgi:tight adherence protein C|nr:type II secretion system F family protein [Candidatus Sulfopaludibacter sp.]
MTLAIFFLATFGLILSGGLLIFYRAAVFDRLQELIHPRSVTVTAGLTEPRRDRIQSVIRPFQNMLPRSADEVSLIQGRLTRAGYRDATALNMFYASRVLVPIILAALATVTGLYEMSPFFVYAAAAGVGFMLPEFWLGNRITARQSRILSGIPEALDLMVICTEAGLGLDQAMARVAKELAISRPDIKDELVLVGLEMKAGRPRADALKNLGERVDLDSVRMLATTLIQSDTFGTSIAKTLRIYSDTLRTKRGQEAEEAAAKTTVKMVFPLVLFIFPALFLVVLGPAGIKIMEGFDTLFQ